MSARRFVPAPRLTAAAPRKRRAAPEEALQRQCVNILRTGCPPFEKGGPVWTAVNPVAAKSKAVAGVSKAMGLRAGWPDLEILYRRQLVYVEFKAPDRGRLSEDQAAIHAALAAHGAHVYIVTSAAGFLAVLRAEAIPCRVREVCEPRRDVHHTKNQKGLQPL